MNIAIIGAGASGMSAAITASLNPNVKVTLFERQNRVGKKLSVTGNGRCNLSNINTSPNKYHGENPEFCKYALDKYTVYETLEWFKNLGLFTVSEPSGRVYPYSDQANSVLDILRFELIKNNIELKTDCEVTAIKKVKNKFIIKTNKDTTTCDKLIIACGGIAGKKIGGNLSGYKLLQSFGHHSTKLRPSLVQIKTDWKGIVSLKGVRANCKASIFHNEKELISSVGEIQFTDYGVSGPVIFEISRDVCTKDGVWECHIDFLPEYSYESIITQLKKRCETELTTDDILTGILHNKVGRVLTKIAGIPSGIPIKNISTKQLETICKTIKKFNINLTEPMGMDYAQVTAGGILTKEFNEKTMESKLISGLFACGEVLDIDGDCGGYNLQWAWSSGRLAGLSASEETT